MIGVESNDMSDVFIPERHASCSAGDSGGVVCSVCVQCARGRHAPRTDQLLQSEVGSHVK